MAAAMRKLFRIDIEAVRVLPFFENRMIYPATKTNDYHMGKGEVVVPEKSRH